MSGARRGALAVGLLACVLAGASRADEEQAERSWPVDEDVRVQIEIVSGRIEIEGWDRPEVRVRVEGDRADEVDIDARRGRISIRSPGRRGPVRRWLGGDVELDVRISLPAKSRIKAETVNGEIHAEGVFGTLELDTANGEIEVEGGPSEARLETINADISFRGRDSRVEARAVNGDIELAGVAEDVSATTISGSVKVSGGPVERVALKTHSGSIEMRTSLAPGARARLKSFSGDIRLELPRETSARFDLETYSGDIRSDLDTAGATRAGRGVGQHLEFRTGEGEARVNAESFSGGIEVRAWD